MDKMPFVTQCHENRGTLLHAAGAGWLMIGADTARGMRIHAANDMPEETRSYEEGVLTEGQQRLGEQTTLNIILGGLSIQFRDGFSVILLNNKDAHEHRPPYTSDCPA